MQQQIKVMIPIEIIITIHEKTKINKMSNKTSEKMLLKRKEIVIQNQKF